MSDYYSDYLVVGAGLAGTSAVEGIRSLDAGRSVTVLGMEEVPPYDRPPLSKKLWFGKKEVKDIFLHELSFYEKNGVKLLLGKRAVTLDAGEKSVTVAGGERYRFGKLLLATGGIPRILGIPGADLDGVCYYRTLGDYERIRKQAAEGKTALIVGGGFIGSEMAASLNLNRVQTTMIYPSKSLCDRVFPEDLGFALERDYESRGIRILKNQSPASIELEGNRFVVSTTGGGRIRSDLVIVGIGIKPAVELAQQAGLKTGDGIVVDEYLQTSHADIYAAGDNARFPYQVLKQQARLEHWDNSLNQGKHAGRNMAGAHEPFSYMPYFFSDLFDFGYEAVGEINPQMDVISDWQKPYDTGVIYYLREGKVRGAMMCNLWNRVEKARELIRRGASADERLD
jgi:NAD(P)H-nitrite reductase large subunit